jgi:ABC-type uncharacterized transport system involved in gliding motility auxiliary subunit
MNDKLKRFAPFGLVLSLVALLALAGLALTSALSSIRIITLPNPDLLTRGMWISAALVLLGLALTALLDPDQVRKFFTGRQARYGSNALVSLLAISGILVLINVLVFENPQSWDVTEDQQNTLAPETIAILETLETPVHARAYYTSLLSSDSVKKLFENFSLKSQGKFTYEFIDPELNTTQAEQDNVERDGTIILVMGEQREVAEFGSEKELAFAILRLKNPGQRLVYFLTGHGEISLDATSEASYSMVRRSLEYKNYIVETLHLLTTGQVPENTQAIVIAGGTTALAKAEIAALEAYLDQGGGLIIMKEAVISAEPQLQNDPLDTLIAKWGIQSDQNFIIDPNVNPASYAVADPNAYAYHPVSQTLLGIYTIFPTSRSLSLTDNLPETLTLTPLAFTGASAWGETDIASISDNTAQFDEGTDLAGPLTLAIAAEDPAKNARLVVFGDSEFASDAIYQQGNGDIIISAVDWAAEQENQIALTPKDPIDRQYKQPGTVGLVAILLGSLCILPLVIAGAGVSTWMARRKRG